MRSRQDPAPLCADAALGAESGADQHLRNLAQHGYAWVRDRFERPADAVGIARLLIDARRGEDGLAPLAIVGSFVLPPLGGGESRDFQTLHFDFGLPVAPKVKRDVGRFTALHVPVDFGAVTAVTRLVPLAALLSQRSWCPRPELLARLVAYGRTHGAWDQDGDYLEGSLARVVEAAAGVPTLPSVRGSSDFLCGLEFDALAAEVDFFARHALRLHEVEIEVALSAGELLVFDNFAFAHGRRGVRRPGELHQWVFGEPALSRAAQCELRDRVLTAFDDQSATDSQSRAGRSVSRDADDARNATT